VEQWEEWEDGMAEVQSSTRSEKEERSLWTMSEEIDKEQAKELENVSLASQTCSSLQPKKAE
jgi:hypothetical protein